MDGDGRQQQLWSHHNWERLSTYFQYSAPIRKLIYTTNAVEGFHRQVRKVTKTKGSFTSEMALMKLVYLASKRIEKKWTAPLQNWALTVQQLAIRFEGRLDLNLEKEESKNKKNFPRGVPPWEKADRVRLTFPMKFQKEPSN